MSDDKPVHVEFPEFEMRDCHTMHLKMVCEKHGMCLHYSYKNYISGEEVKPVCVKCNFENYQYPISDQESGGEVF